jgi:hypothetical protein
MLKFNNSEEFEIAQTKFHEFCQFEGCDYIAGEYALYSLLKLCKQYNVKSILEIGLGIGCIADTLLFYYHENNKPIKYIGTEANEFCIKALKSNTTYYNEIGIYTDLNAINDSQTFDLIIVDGGNTDLDKLKHLVSSNTILFVEGCRENQFVKIRQLFPKALAVDVISKIKNRDYSPFIKSHWMGGGRIIFTNPSFGIYVHYLKEKISTKLKYRYRRRKNIT